MRPYPWTDAGTPSDLGHMDRVAVIMPSQAHAGEAQDEPDIGQWEGQDVPLVRPSSCIVKGGILSSRRYLPTYLDLQPVDSVRSRLPGLVATALALHVRQCLVTRRLLAARLPLLLCPHCCTDLWRRPRRQLLERVLGLRPLSRLSNPFSPFPFLASLRMPSP